MATLDNSFMPRQPVHGHGLAIVAFVMPMGYDQVIVDQAIVLVTPTWQNR